ncbi:MAG: endo-1,4-beta-xylanase [Bryobacteraceae bacterium]|jgi:endo-1,4-beta-xylanase
MKAAFLLLIAMLAAQASPPATLKDAFKGAFLIGAAVNAQEFGGKDAELITAQFNSISPENDLKWEKIHPEPDRYNFGPADRYVAFGEQHHMYIVGHCLVWHSQTPAWVFHDDKGNRLTRDALLARMRDHIHTVVGRYKGRIQSWDVVNEALDEDGAMRQSPWLKIIGPDYIAKAFQFAHEADPAAILTYNDYALENEAKRKGALELIRSLKEQGVPVSEVGNQGHDHMDWPSTDAEDATIAAFGALGVKVAITEFDINVLPQATRQQTADVSLSVEARKELNPYPNGLPDAMQEALAKRYAGLFAVFMKHRDVVARVTFWGVTDGGSWLNNWPVKGRTNYPLLFDRGGQPKPAFDAVVRAVAP